MTKPSNIRTQIDLERVGRALGYHFKTDTIVVIGSQSVLVGWPDAPTAMRTSSEIDAYPANFQEWQSRPENEGLEASEEINALFGNGSHFHSSHGFYIDGVDSRTAQLPQDWQRRAIYREIEGVEQTVTIIAPSVPDMAVSKLIRLVEKDRDWLRACHEVRPFDIPDVLSQLDTRSTSAAVRLRAKEFLTSLPQREFCKRGMPLNIPEHDPTTHCVTVLANDGSLVVRVWDDVRKLFIEADNPLGPAIVKATETRYFLDGHPLSRDEWVNDERVQITEIKSIR